MTRATDYPEGGPREISRVVLSAWRGHPERAISVGQIISRVHFEGFSDRPGEAFTRRWINGMAGEERPQLRWINPTDLRLTERGRGELAWIISGADAVTALQRTILSKWRGGRRVYSGFSEADVLAHAREAAGIPASAVRRELKALEMMGLVRISSDRVVGVHVRAYRVVERAPRLTTGASARFVVRPKQPKQPRLL